MNLAKDNEIEIFKKELQSNKELAEQMSKEMNENIERFKEHQTELTERLSEYMNKSSQLETENERLHI